MTQSPVFGHPSEPSPAEVLRRARSHRVTALRAAEDLLNGAEHRPGDHDNWRYNIARHREAIAAFDAALMALPA
jgi:hypothetical protein